MRSLPRRESADFRIGQAQGREPLNLSAGRKEGYLADCFAYGPGGRARVANNKPWDVFQTLMAGGAPGAPGLDPTLAARNAARERSVNDVLRAESRRCSPSRSSASRIGAGSSCTSSRSASSRSA